MLFASIMKARGVPTRIRAGWAPYIGEMIGRKDLHPGHAVCETWSEKTGRWVLVDPDRQLVDIPYRKFERPCDIWPKLRDGRIEGKRYRSYRGAGAYAVIHMLCLDLRCVLNDEVPYWLDPSVAADVGIELDALDEETLALLDRVAELLEDPDGNLDELARIYEDHSCLQARR
jgi:hypothetical protein